METLYDFLKLRLRFEVLSGILHGTWIISVWMYTCILDEIKQGLTFIIIFSEFYGVVHELEGGRERDENGV